MEQCPEATQWPQQGNSHKRLTNRFLLKAPSKKQPIKNCPARGLLDPVTNEESQELRPEPGLYTLET